MSWFRTSGSGSFDNGALTRAPIKEVIQNIHPSSTGEQECDRNRFSQLLLEHGEQHLQDWAVTASSCEAAPSTSKSSTLSSSTKTEWNKSGRSRSNKRVGPNRSSNTATMSSTSNMGKIEGRLHLCSRSIVFEPMDNTRGIIRCPFAKMEAAPKGIAATTATDAITKQPLHRETSATSLLGSSYEKISSPLTVNFMCSRHVVMKENNVIGPFESIEVPVNFRFTFLHSSPERFVELCVELYKMVHSTKRINPNDLEEIMKPMLNRPFDPSNLVDIREKPLTSNLRCALVSPLQSRPGCAIVTSLRLYFQPAAGVLSPMETRAMSWLLTDILAVARRYSGLKDCAVEIYWKDGTSVLLAFDRQREREKVLRVLPNKHAIWCHSDRDFVFEATKEWQRGSLSNYDYLLALNSAAGRTFLDLSRYPVFPWVIADYSSSTLNLTKPETFRDLTKPMGALNEERLDYFRTRLTGMHDMEHPFLYGTHYSAPGYILYYLVRSMPEHMLCLQNGKFDAPDRMFHDIEKCFSCALTNHADVKELIPEFYNPSGGFDFLINARNLQLGATQLGDRVNDVSMPPWARSPRDFLRKNRKALESEICTNMLPQWVDLIFGVNSRGEAATEACNLFHPNAYLSPADLDNMATEEDRAQAQLQAVEFGIVPDELFGKAHPARSDLVENDDFITSTLGKVEFVTESDGLTDGDSSRQGEQAWELLEPPSNSSHEDAPRVIEQVGSHDSNQVGSNVSRSVGFGAAAGMVSSAKMKAFSEKISPVRSPNSAQKDALATPGAKAKASWAPEVPRADTFEEGTGVGHRPESNVRQSSSDHPAMSKMDSSVSDRSQSLPLSGSGNVSREIRATGSASFGDSSHQAIKTRSNRDASAAPAVSQDNPDAAGWDLKTIEKKSIHSDAVSGCCISLLQGPQNMSFITTVSLDSKLLVQSLSLNETDSSSSEEFNLRGLGSTLSRLPYLGLNQPAASTKSKLGSHRTHTASDPLACLSVTNDGSGGQLVFAGGHDDVVLAYGINSACAVASVYSHRDAVTGLDIIPKPQQTSENVFWTDKTTHIMVSGSWDATVKVWSVAVASGETVSINREPLAELFDADSTIVCLSATYIASTGVAISAGCSDGSFVAWLCHDDGTKVLIHKEPPRRSAGPCSAVKWSQQLGQTYLFAGFSAGKLASYVLENGGLRRVSAVSVGVAAQCLEFVEGVLLVGCADGGLRLLPLRSGATFDGKPTLWKAVNGKDAPGITCLSVGFTADPSSGIGKCICATGASDGSVAICELKKADLY